MIRARRLAALVACTAALAGCEARRETAPPPPPPVEPPPAAPSPRFTRVPLTGASDLAALTERLGPDGLDAVLRLNRLDAGHAWQGDTLVVPEPLPPFTALSPYPRRLAVARDVPKLLLVSIRVQAWAAYERGLLARWGPTSTGKPETPTCAALYYTNWKSKERRSTVNPNWVLRWYFNFESQGGCSFHVYDLPGRPASHSCVRLDDADAEWIYHWADQWVLSADESAILRHGTPVVIFGEFDYETPAPWKRLPEDTTAHDLSAGEIEEALAVHAGGDSLSSRSREGLRVVAQLDTLPATLDLSRLERDLAAAGPFVLDGLDLLPRQAVFWQDADRRADFDTLRAAFGRHGVGVRDFLVDGYGRALRLDGVASFVSPKGERLFYIESMDVPGMSADSIVWARFEGLVSVRGEAGDPHAPFRIVLSRVEPVP